MANLQFCLLTKLSEVADIQPGWQHLQALGCLPSVFQHPGWVDAWWHSFGVGRDPFFVVGWCDDSIVGIVPLMIDSGIRHAQFIGHPLNDRNGAICLDGYLDPLWSATLDLLARSGVVSADFPELLDADANALSSVGRVGVQLTPGRPSPVIDLPATWDEFLARHDGPRVRRWYREERRLADLGTIRFECLAGDDASTGLMYEFHRSRVERWSFTGQLTELAEAERSDEFARFLARLARNLAPDRMLRLGRLHAGTDVVAQDLYFVWPGVTLNYMKTYQPGLRNYSPGRHATLAGIRHFISEGLPVFDFGRGDEQYKFSLGARNRDLSGITVSFGT